MTGLEPLIVAAAAGSVAKVATETLMEKGGWLELGVRVSMKRQEA